MSTKEPRRDESDLGIVSCFNSIQFSFICMAPFTTKLSLGCFTMAETQSQNPQVSTVAGKTLPFNRKKPRAGPGSQGGTFLLRVGRVKDENERDRTERAKRGGEREKENI